MKSQILMLGLILSIPTKFLAQDLSLEDLTNKTSTLMARDNPSELSWSADEFSYSFEKETAPFSSLGLLDDIEDLIGTTLPPFSVVDTDGNRWRSQALRGKVIVMNFWFIGCKPCIEEMPELNKIVEDMQDQDVVFLAFGLDPSRQINNFLELHPFSYHIIPNSGNYTTKELGVTRFPTLVVVDPEGIVTYAHSGFGTGTISRLKQAIRKAQ